MVPDGQPLCWRRSTGRRIPTTSQVLAAILQALNRIHADIPVIFPVHPRTKQVIDTYGMELRLITIPPLGYLDMLGLVQAAGYVVTDSGRGLSREAFFFRKPSVIVMKQMFWPEISLHGPSLAAAAQTDAILTTFRALQGPIRPFDTVYSGMDMPRKGSGGSS